MKVKELIQYLQLYNWDFDVVIETFDEEYDLKEIYSVYRGEECKKIEWEKWYKPTTQIVISPFKNGYFNY